jgi:hypothetical protein
MGGRQMEAVTALLQQLLGTEKNPQAADGGSPLYWATSKGRWRRCCCMQSDASRCKPLAALVAKARLALEQARAVQVGQARATAEEAEAAAAAEADCRRWRSCVEGARCILTHGLCGTSIVPHCYH